MVRLKFALALLVVTFGLCAKTPGAVIPLKLMQTLPLTDTLQTIAGLTSYDGLLWSTAHDSLYDWTVVGIAPKTGQIVQQSSPPGATYLDTPQGLACDGGTFYASLSSRQVQSFELGSESGSSFPSFGGASPTGLAWDGKYLWQATGGSGQNLFRIDPSSEERMGSFTVDPGVVDLTWDGRNLWVLSNPTSMVTRVSRYDRSGRLIETFGVPSGIASLDGLAYDGKYLWGIDQSNLYRFAKPKRQHSPPKNPAGMLWVSYDAQVQTDVGADAHSDSQSGLGYSQLPVACYLENGDAQSPYTVSGTARGYYTSTGSLKHIVGAMAFSEAQEASSTGAGRLALTQDRRITSSMANLRNGKSIKATGNITLTGTWDVTRSDSTVDIRDLAASFGLTVSLTRSGHRTVTIFEGAITVGGAAGDGLESLGTGGPGSDFYAYRKGGADNWVTCFLSNDMNSLALRKEIRKRFSVDPTLAKLTLSGFKIPYKLPVKVGEAFTLEVVMTANAYIPPDVSGGAEVAFGQSPELQTYRFGVRPTPEPATLTILFVGAIALIRKRSTASHA